MRPLAILAALHLCLPAATLAAPVAVPAASVYHITDPAQALTFDGFGWGHGVGLCQWGARGRALAGQTGEQIIAAYYPGTTIQRLVAPETTIRVLLHQDLQIAAGRTHRITGRGGPWQVETSGAQPVEGPANGYLELAAGDGAVRYAIKDQDGNMLAQGAMRGPLALRPLDGSTRFAISYKPAAEVPGRPGVHYDTYRGELILSPLSGGIETINRVLLEDYLRGVVPAEMPALWPVEALKAQTLAARTYAVWQARRRAAQRFDVDDTTQYQVYLGAYIERDNVNRLIDATTGQVVTHGGQLAQTYFFSTCAGWTENNEDVWGGQPLPYLRGISDVDPSGRPYDADAPLFSWTTGALFVWQLEQILNTDERTSVGRLQSLDLSHRTRSGRLISLRATGTYGTRTISPDTLMARFNRLRPSGVTPIRSTNFDLKWTTAAAVMQTQGGSPTPDTTPAMPTATPRSPQAAPAPAESPPPPSAPTPTFRLEHTDPAPARPNGPTNQYFATTGHNVGGAFLRFFNEMGGLDTFGYPRTEELLEDGKTVQYFQRARFEFNVDKVGTPYEVQLALLGDVLTVERRPFPKSPPFASTDERVYFPETGYSLSFGFLKFWRERGGLDLFGYPISEELTENGFTVQYFQRARFEYHPELPAPYRVSLGLLGDQLLVQRYWLV